MELNVFDLRLYDPVIGRWHSVDPKRIGASPYIGMGNNPASMNDPDGGGPLDNITIYSDGSQTTEVVPGSTTDTYTYYDLETSNQFVLATLERNSNGLSQLPDWYFVAFDDDHAFGFSTYSSSKNRYLSQESAAALFGAIFETQSWDLQIGNFSQSNGATTSPSVSHVNGKNGDLRFLRNDYGEGAVTLDSKYYSYERTAIFTTALNKYGWKNILSEYDPSGRLLPYTNYNSKVKSSHYNHIHLQGFKPDSYKY